MANPSVTWTFTNGTTSDASQVNTNFTNLISGMTDGSKDFSIGTLNVAGATNLNGTVTLGDSTADDLTLTGSLAASITVKTNATYNFGSSSSALLSVYLGNGTHTTRLLAGTVSSSWTFTFPDNAPTQAGMGLAFTSAGAAVFRYPDKYVAAQTGTAYVGTGDETEIPADASGGVVTINLPAVSGFTGKKFTVKKVDSTSTAVTVKANGAETIDGVNTVLIYAPNESYTFKTNGVVWYIDRHFVPMSDIGLMLSTGAGHGSTATKVRRWGVAEANTLGVYATYADSATAGMLVTINVPGLYAVGANDSRAAGGSFCGLTVNCSVALTTTINLMTYAQGMRAYNGTGAATSSGYNFTGYFAAGDLLRHMTEGNADNATVDSFFFLRYLGR